MKETEVPRLLNEVELKELQGPYNEKNLNAVKGQNYKLFVIKLKTFDDIPSVQYGDYSYERNLVYSLLRSGAPLEQFADDLVARDPEIKPEMRQQTKDQVLEDIGKQIRDGGQLRSSFFGLLVAGKMQKEGPLFLMYGVKDKTITIYKETLMFKLVKLLPRKALRLLGGK